MPTDSATGYAVYVGAWTDWSRGRILGATVTLSRQDGNLLIAFLAFFVALVGTRFWRLGCLVLHYLYSKDRPSDGIYHQRQVFLRNAPNPESALWTLADIGFSWRANAEKVWIRLLPPYGLAVASFVGFTLASGFSSRVTALVSSEVLLSATNCSLLANDTNMTTYGDTEGPLVTADMIAAENYARQCYTSGPVGGSCGTFVKSRLVPAVVDTNASCPFDTKVCKSATGNLLIDTGLLETHHDFGLNSPTNRRMKFRRTVHCAALAAEGYRYTTYDNITNQSYTTYYYGPMENVNGTTMNYTEKFSNNVYPTIEALTHNADDTMHDFSIRTHFAQHVDGSILPGSSTFYPIPELNPQNSSLYIFFLTSGRILFAQPSNDDWYGETTNTVQVHKLRTSDWGNATFYRQNKPGSPLACKELEQYCFTGVSGQEKCTPLEGRDNAVADLDALRGQEDKEWMSWLIAAIFGDATLTKDPIVVLSTHALRARDRLNEQILGPLPDNQWQLEVQHWHATNMAYLQRLFLEPPVGVADPKYSHLASYPKTAAANETCANQKILAEGFVSVSIFGLSCIFIFGALIIVLSFALGPVFSCCLRRSGRYNYAKLEWSATDAFQLQRLAHEGIGMGTWSRGTESIPVTRPGERLAAMDVTSFKHPVLRAYGQAHNEQTDQQRDQVHNANAYDLEARSPKEKPSSRITVVERAPTA